MEELIKQLEKVIQEREQKLNDYPEEELFGDKFRKLIKGNNVLRKAVKVLKGQ